MHIQVTDITGAKWTGDKSDEALTDDTREALHEILRDFSDLNHLSLEVGGAKHYFNPAHVVTVSIHEKD